jgi:DNA mismatch repair protein MutS
MNQKIVDNYSQLRISSLTPLFKQYISIKNKYKDCILLFRVGDFYETYFEDARIFSSINNVILTKKELPDGYAIPLAGVPFHSVDNYIKNLVKAGYKVAIAEQLEDPKDAKGQVVKRDVVQVITPGTIIQNEYLDNNTYNFLMVIDYVKNNFIFLFSDVSALKIFVSKTNFKDLINLIDSIKPSEVIISNKIENKYLQKLNEVLRINNIAFNTLSADDVVFDEIENYLFDKVSLYTLEKNEAILAFKLLIKSLNYSMISNYKFKVYSYIDNDSFLIDENTIKNLDLFNSNPSLLNIIDKTLTPFGSRNLKLFILKPLKNIEKINQRLDVIEFFIKNNGYIISIREGLKSLTDVERVLPKFLIYKASFKEFQILKKFLNNITNLIDIIIEIYNIKSLPILAKDIINNIIINYNEIKELQELLNKSILDEVFKHNEIEVYINKGFNKDLDEYIDILLNSKRWLERYENELKIKTGIKSLKIGYNQVFGYYIEVTKTNLNLVPSYFERKQTLTNAERFTTKELKEFEEKLASSLEKISEIQNLVIYEITEYINTKQEFLLNLIQNIALLDILVNFSYIAIENNYIRPKLVNDKVLKIKGLRHPIYEKYFEYFIDNDINLDEEEYVIILTGPNMGGKSTFLKTVAINVLLSHVGSFIPAKEATIGVVDKILTRMGSGDDIIKKRSTFMVEMLETAYILDNSTEYSLVILDEIGRGTSTYDGMAIAWALCEYFAKTKKCRTLLATHFHQLSNLEKYISAIKNYHVEVIEKEDDIIFTYKIKPGFADKSYGLHVAKIAGVNPEVISIANNILQNFEKFTGIKVVQTKLIK